MGLSPHSPEAVGAAPPRVVIDTDNRFSLDPGFLAQYAGQQPIWGPLGYIVYKRTYARRVGNRSEEFWETLRRVTEGTFSLLKQQIRSAHRPWDDAEAQRKAQDFYARMWAFKWLPPGRGLWIMGTDYLERHGGGAANNCGFVSTCDLATDFADVTGINKATISNAKSGKRAWLGLSERQAHRLADELDARAEASLALSRRLRAMEPAVVDGNKV